jgi:endonuclease YncB( thermonuclease family)
MGLCWSCNNNVAANKTSLSMTSSDVKEFSLDGQEHIAKVVYVYDGDTVHIVLNFNNIPTKFNCRLAGIDCPELHPINVKDEKSREIEKNKAIKSRNYLITKVTDQSSIKENMTKKDIKDLCAKSRQLVRVKCFGFDKYGRLLIEIFEGNGSSKSINQEMIDNLYAVPYDGGTKEEFNVKNFS